MDVAKILARLDADGATYSTSMKTEAFATNENATASVIRTLPTVRFNYTIRIQPSYIAGAIDMEPNSPPTCLSIATTIIHELVHVYFLSLVDEQATTNPLVLEEFPLLFEAYVIKKHGSSYTSAQHETMAIHYVNTIACALQEFHTRIPVTNIANLQQSFKDLAWQGLESTTIFNNPNGLLNDIDRNRINNRRIAEERNQQRGDQNPIGTPCI